MNITYKNTKLIAMIHKSQPIMARYPITPPQSIQQYSKSTHHCRNKANHHIRVLNKLNIIREDRELRKRT